MKYERQRDVSLRLTRLTRTLVAAAPPRQLPGSPLSNMAQTPPPLTPTDLPPLPAPYAPVRGAQEGGRPPQAGPSEPRPAQPRQE